MLLFRGGTSFHLSISFTLSMTFGVRLLIPKVRYSEHINFVYLEVR